MTRLQLVKRLAEFATQPLTPDSQCSEPVETSSCTALVPLNLREPADLYVWFEDTSSRHGISRRGVAGLPESLLPYSRGMRIVERRYAEGHLHLLSAVRLRCRDQASERIAALYTAALSVGTIAWIGTGRQYERAWQEMYSNAHATVAPDQTSEI